MTVSYALAAATAIMNSGHAAQITERDDMRRANDGDLMACITMTSGVIMTIPCAYLRIVGPSQLRGMFDAIRDGVLLDGVMCTIKAAHIADVDYFTL